MERLLASGVSAANTAQYQLRVIANNLANVNTTGFKADHMHVVTQSNNPTDLASLNQPLSFGTRTDTSGGAFQTTGRTLDVAIEQSNGWFSVLDEQGDIAYTRAGNLSVGVDGVLQSRGRPIQGRGGDIVIPKNAPIQINGQGDILIQGEDESSMELLDRFAMITAQSGMLLKGEDGLFRSPNGDGIEESSGLSIQSGVLESSNVNAVEEMLRTVDVSRQFDLNLKILSTADTLAQSGNDLIRG